MADKPPPNAETDAESTDAPPVADDKSAGRKALHEQQKRELPSNDWPGKGAA